MSIQPNMSKEMVRTIYNTVIWADKRMTEKQKKSQELSSDKTGGDYSVSFDDMVDFVTGLNEEVSR